MDVKQVVKNRYGRIAQGRGGCGSARSCKETVQNDTTAQVIGYSAEDVNAVPEGANLGLGCGNPLALAQVQPGDVVLDLGSGAGFDAFLAAERVGPEGRVIGVDMTEEMITQARANAEKGGYTNTDFRLGDIEQLPVADNSIDLVISNCVLNLVPDKAQVFREIARVLSPDGQMLISDLVVRGELPSWLRENAAAYAACIGGAVEQEHYLNYAREAGLTDVEVLSQTDAVDLLTASSCGCASGPEAIAPFRGKIFSISVRARKPA